MYTKLCATIRVGIRMHTRRIISKWLPWSIILLFAFLKWNLLIIHTPLLVGNFTLLYFELKWLYPGPGPSPVGRGGNPDFFFCPMWRTVNSTFSAKMIYYLLYTHSPCVRIRAPTLAHMSICLTYDCVCADPWSESTSVGYLHAAPRWAHAHLPPALHGGWHWSVI